MPRTQPEPSAVEAVLRLAHRLPHDQTKIPGLRKLSEELGFTVAQVRTAVRQLSDQGVLKPIHGSGTFLVAGQTRKSRMETLETASLAVPGRRTAPIFHVLCVPQLVTSPLHAQMLVAIVNAFTRRNEVVQIDTVPLEEWDDWVQQKRQLRGLLVTEFATRNLARILQRRKTPWVVLNRVPDGVSANGVVLDDCKLMAVLVDHLHGLGHRRIGLCYYTTDSPSARLRKAGFLRRCREHAIRAFLQPVGEGAPLSLTRLLESGCTAVTCQNDDLALQVIREAKRLGIEVPSQLSVCGVDNTPEGIRNQPALTTVHFSLPMMGEWAVKMLLALNPRSLHRPQQWIVPSEVVARQSTAAPAPHHVKNGISREGHAR